MQTELDYFRLKEAARKYGRQLAQRARYTSDFPHGSGPQVKAVACYLRAKACFWDMVKESPVEYTEKLIESYSAGQDDFIFRGRTVPEVR